jgi:uncharacterized OsmC-like protein
LSPDSIQATAHGYNEIRDRVPVLVRIHLQYRLVTPPASRDVVEKALARHAGRCPTALSLKGAVEVTWEAEVQEDGETWRMEGG